MYCVGASVQYSVLVPGASCTVGKLGHWESQPSRPQILASTAESASYSRVVRVVASDCGTLVVLHHCCHPPLLGPLVRAQASLSFSNLIPLSLTSSSPIFELPRAQVRPYFSLADCRAAVLPGTRPPSDPGLAPITVPSSCTVSYFVVI